MSEDLRLSWRVYARASPRYSAALEVVHTTWVHICSSEAAYVWGRGVQDLTDPSRLL